MIHITSWISVQSRSDAGMPQDTSRFTASCFKFGSTSIERIHFSRMGITECTPSEKSSPDCSAFFRCQWKWSSCRRHKEFLAFSALPTRPSQKTLAQLHSYHLRKPLHLLLHAPYVQVQLEAATLCKRFYFQVRCNAHNPTFWASYVSESIMPHFQRTLVTSTFSGRQQQYVNVLILGSHATLKTRLFELHTFLWATCLSFKEHQWNPPEPLTNTRKWGRSHLWEQPTLVLSASTTCMIGRRGCLIHNTSMNRKYTIQSTKRPLPTFYLAFGLPLGNLQGHEFPSCVAGRFPPESTVRWTWKTEDTIVLHQLRLCAQQFREPLPPPLRTLTPQRSHLEQNTLYATVQHALFTSSSVKQGMAGSIQIS